MTLAKRKPRTWLCKCGYRNEARTSSRRCQSCGENTKPKRRVPKHAETLRDDSYRDYEMATAQIHGVIGECACCGTVPKTGRLERDHGHKDYENSFGKPRGLLCHRCNKYLVGSLSLAEARAVVAYLERVEAHYARSV